MATFLLKTEPSEFAFEQLPPRGRPGARWDGVANPAALIHLRSMAKGDAALVYHTGDEKAVVGLAVAVSAPYADPARPGTNDRGEPKFAVIDLCAVAPAKAPLTLAAIRADKRLAGLPLVTQGRLSVMPVPEPLAAIIRAATGLKQA